VRSWHVQSTLLVSGTLDWLSPVGSNVSQLVWQVETVSVIDSRWPAAQCYRVGQLINSLGQSLARDAGRAMKSSTPPGVVHATIRLHVNSHRRLLWLVHCHHLIRTTKGIGRFWAGRCGADQSGHCASASLGRRAESSSCGRYKSIHYLRSTCFAGDFPRRLVPHSAVSRRFRQSQPNFCLVESDHGATSRVRACALDQERECKSKTRSRLLHPLR
jgi:hypothetical protein